VLTHARTKKVHVPHQHQHAWASLLLTFRFDVPPWLLSAPNSSHLQSSRRRTIFNGENRRACVTKMRIALAVLSLTVAAGVGAFSPSGLSLAPRRAAVPHGGALFISAGADSNSLLSLADDDEGEPRRFGSDGRGTFLGIRRESGYLRRSLEQKSSVSPLMPDGGLSPCVIKVLGVGGGGSNAVSYNNLRIAENMDRALDQSVIHDDLFRFDFKNVISCVLI